MDWNPYQYRLDPRHIRSVQLDRQAINRARRMRIIFGIASIVAALQLIYLMIPNLQAGDSNQQAIGAIELFGALILSAIGAWLLYQAHLITKGRLPSISEQTASLPDFSTLSNGSQFAEQLTQMTDNRELNSDILNHALNLAMDWGEDFMQPTQARMQAIYPEFSAQQLDAIDEYVRTAMKYGHAIATGDFNSFKKAVNTQFSWVSDDNLHRMFNQGMYYANK